MISLITILIASAALRAGTSPSPQDSLQVLWHSPSDTAGPSSVITVMFDRPVASELDSTIRASRVFHIEPAVPGKAVWRDPVTIVFVPTTPLQPGARYTVTIDSSLKGADGSRIGGMSSFAFRVFGPRLLERSFNPYSGDTLAPDGRVQLLYTAPVDLARLERGARLELTGCQGAGSVAFRARQRPLRTDDPSRFLYAGGVTPDSVVARFRTLVELEPVTTPPVECPATIVIPTTDDESSIGKEERYSLHTVAVARALRFGRSPFSDWMGKTLEVEFASPMRRADIVRYVRLNGQAVTIDGQEQLQKRWVFRVALVPRTTHVLAIDPGVRDAYDRPLTGTRQFTVAIGDFESRVAHAAGIITVPRSGAHTFPLRSMNARSVKVIGYRVPDSARVAFMTMVPGVYDPNRFVRGLAAETTLVELPDRLNVDTTTDVPLPRIALAADHPMVLVQTILAERLRDAYTARDYEGGRLIALPTPNPSGIWDRPPYTTVQVTDLAVTARLAAVTDGAAFVTDLTDGQPRDGVRVTQIDPFGRVVAIGTSNAEGIATLARVATDSAPAPRTPVTPYATPRFTVLKAEAGDDRVIVSLGGSALGYRPGSSLKVESLGGRLDDSPLAAGALFFDRDIFRPGEMLHVKGVVRRGMLGELSVPESTDSVRLVIRRQQYSWPDDNAVVIRDTVMHPSSFGTIVDSVPLRSGLPLGSYTADLSIVAGLEWRRIRTALFNIAEYRAPEFLVSLKPDTAVRCVGDTVGIGIEGRFVFNAPMRGAVVRWTAEPTFDYRVLQSAPKGWVVGTWLHWAGGPPQTPGVKLSGIDTLDRDGRARIRIRAPAAFSPWPAALRVHAAVVDVSNQTVSAQTLSATIYSGRVFAAARVPSSSWRLGSEGFVEVRAVDIKGVDVRNAVIRTFVLRHRLLPENTDSGLPGRWVIDTLRRTELRPNGAVARVSFTPDSAGEYAVDFLVTDSLGGVTRTGVSVGELVGDSVRATPPKPQPLGYRVPLRAERPELDVGEQARVHFDSPFEDAEAWITFEREGIIEQRRERAHRGDNLVTFAVQARYAPNIWMSVVLTARGETARPDSATHRLRAAYIELRVRPTLHRLVVHADVERSSYRPRDTATIRVRVADTTGRGVRSEVALWAVDVGVLSMTQMRAPDLIWQIYAGRGVGGQLWSTVPTMLTTDPWLVSMFLDRAMMMLNAVVMTSAANADMMVAVRGLSSAARQDDPARTRFASTAFFIGNVQTDDRGAAIVRAPVPDNLTTFHVYAVAVSAADQYGTGEAELLVTKPLVARAALPRFVRPTDSLRAGVIVTARESHARSATTTAAVSGAALRGPARASVSLVSKGDQRAHFVVQVPQRDIVGDSISVRFDAVDGATTDAVITKLPVRPDFHARTHAVLGATRDSQTVMITLPADIDPVHSRLRLRIGTSRLSAMLASYRWLRAYPYECTEQLSSVGRGIIAVWEATKNENRDALGGDPRAKLQEIADEISRRQRPDGAFRYWPTVSWSSAWLTAYAGSFLLEARDLGVSVSPDVIRLASNYLANVSRAPVDTGGMNRFQQRDRRLALGGRIAAVEFLRRAANPDTAAERRLIRVAAAMMWEDRLRIAELVADRRDLRAAADSILDAAWREVKPAGHRVDLPDSANGPREFPSRVAPAARLLSATLVLRPTHSLLGALVETVLQQGRAESRFAWSTQDYASLVMALAHFGDGDRGGRIVNARAGNSRFVARPQAKGVDTTISAPLTGLLETLPSGKQVLRVNVETSADERPVYFALEVDEVPRAVPVTPDIQGIVVERWYERFDDGKPVTRVAEGDLVRVRLKVTVPADRAFVALEDPLPAGLEPIDSRLRTSGVEAFASTDRRSATAEGNGSTWQAFLYGRWDGGRWSPWEHQELHDDRVSYFARVLWTGSYTATYLARATTAGSFVAPPAYAEEMYNPALQGRTAGLRLLIEGRP